MLKNKMYEQAVKMMQFSYLLLFWMYSKTNKRGDTRFSLGHLIHRL